MVRRSLMVAPFVIVPWSKGQEMTQITRIIYAVHLLQAKWKTTNPCPLNIWIFPLLLISYKIGLLQLPEGHRYAIPSHCWQFDNNHLFLYNKQIRTTVYSLGSTRGSSPSSQLAAYSFKINLPRYVPWSMFEDQVFEQASWRDHLPTLLSPIQPVYISDIHHTILLPLHLE